LPVKTTVLACASATTRVPTPSQNSRLHNFRTASNGGLVAFEFHQTTSNCYNFKGIPLDDLFNFMLFCPILKNGADFYAFDIINEKAFCRFDVVAILPNKQAQ